MECRQTITLKRTSKGQTPVVPCGQCLNCRLNRRDKWVTRCLLESQSAITGQFWTLTFSDEGLSTLEEQGPRLLVRKFLNALRQKERRHLNPKKIRSFGALEYGELTNRPHLHLLLWNMIHSIQPTTAYKEGLPLPFLHTELWPHGHINVQPLNASSCRYVCKYVTKFEIEGKEPTVFHCQRPPLGLAGLHQHLEYISKSPAKNWEQPTTIELDGRQWALDHTMRQHYMLKSRSLGLESPLNSLPKWEKHIRAVIEEKQAKNLNEIERTLRREQRRDRLFDITLAKRESRKFSVWQRAAALSAVERSHTHPNAISTASDI